MEEKSLVKKEKLNIFQKIERIFKKLFFKQSDFEKKYIEENSEDLTIIDQFKKEREILNLQQNYELGNILEENLTDIEKEELLLLYKKQIETLEENVKTYKSKLENYKIKILEKKQKLEGNN